ncbi:MAG: adenosylcobinamide-phosphate synthase CbiB [Desulfovibrionales bacterium]|nr:adenosylcobinamide-phosphate synthase CbiB [Desulfovibrionales bacterium]
MSETLIFFLLVCYLTDVFIGDPARWPHPVRIIGRTLDMLEPVLRKSGHSLKFLGFAVLFTGAFATLFSASLLISLPFLGFIFSLYLGYACLALGCLIHEIRKVQKLIDSGSLQEARKAISFLVSRDTSELNEQELYQTLAETLSENYNDAFCAPFFYLSLLGVPWAWMYKLVSTMDSMWGYKTDKWNKLGFAGAKADDILAYIPARLATLSMIGAAYIMNLRKNVRLSEIAVDAGRMESPNAGWTMSAGAHILGVRMGGNASYFGEKKFKPVLGRGREIYSSTKIDQLVSLILISSFLYALGFIVLAAIVR